MFSPTVSYYAFPYPFILKLMFPYLSYWQSFYPVSLRFPSLNTCIKSHGCPKLSLQGFHYPLTLRVPLPAHLKCSPILSPNGFPNILILRVPLPSHLEWTVKWSCNKLLLIFISHHWLQSNIVHPMQVTSEWCHTATTRGHVKHLERAVTGAREQEATLNRECQTPHPAFVPYIENKKQT